MLDVYRTYYKLTGEPFRLSPDHRFSLGHRSYANAKAYLDYALLQGEGFIAITGGPGTGGGSDGGVQVQAPSARRTVHRARNRIVRPIGAAIVRNAPSPQWRTIPDPGRQKRLES